MATTTWKETLLKIGGLLLILSLFSIVLYPKPVEIVFLSTIGIGILLLLVLIYLTWENNQKPEMSVGKKILKIAFLSIIIAYSLYMSLVIRTSWWEHRLVFDILQTKRGIAYVIITCFVVLIFALYNLFYYYKHRGWPPAGDLVVHKKSTSLTRQEISILIAAGIALAMSLVLCVIIYRFYVALTKNG
jgi:hypothetical protein